MLRGMREQTEPMLLDVGCGRVGMAAFMNDVTVVGVDLSPPDEYPPNFTFQEGSITNLPFDERSFPVVTCIDVIEHLPLDARGPALRELVRVASRAVLIACPQGPVAERCDAEFRRSLEARARPVPEWVFEHQAEPYPTSSVVSETIRLAAETSGRTLRTSLSYSEPVSVCRLVRRAAAGPKASYLATNLLFGALLPLMPAPNADSGYRMILLAEFAPYDA